MKDLEKGAKIYVAGHRGLVGSAIVRELTKQGYTNLLYKSHKELDLENQQAVINFFKAEKPPIFIYDSMENTSYLPKFSVMYFTLLMKIPPFLR